MKIRLRFVFENFLTRKRINIYFQEDTKYFVLVTPLNPRDASETTVQEFHGVTLEEAFEMVRP